DGAMPLEYSVRLPVGERRPDRLRFVSYYPLVNSTPLRREINRGRRAAARRLAAHWLTAAERRALDVWLACAEQTQPDTLGLSIGLEIDADGVRLQVYAHPEPVDATDDFVAAAVETIGGSSADVPPRGTRPVLVGLALCANRSPTLKLYYQRAWQSRGD